ncbi:nuclease SbcCD subunit C-like isoform X1 [Mytilus californianus]|uniref:nuclease SbcCD subunit C-like isoform X1 n=1 Tax=Mytilus californianus TaxID=6549 RepID=UPI0022472FC4|nr:nuclease SbcCD subunit C-like isoform X1 [Mytilus californianus]
MASSKPVPCAPCQEGKVKTKADIWCYNCEEGLCSTCSVHHKRSKSSRDHKIIDIKSYKPSIRAIKTECGKHGQQLNLYCPSHLMPCCDECISISHSKCTGIKSLASVVEKTKIDQSTQSLEKQINSIKHFLEKLVTNKSKNITRGEREYESIQDFIVKIRKKINIHLTNLEKKLCNEAETIWNQEKSQATEVISEIERKQKNLNKMQDHLQTVISHTSKLQSFLGLHQIEQQIHQCQQYVEDLEKDDRAKEFDIKMRQNVEIEKILSKLESLESLGKVTSVKTYVDLNKDTSVRREAQVESREQTNIRNMTMNIETKIEINMKKVISDMICLMDGRVIVVEQERRVNLLTSDGKLQKQLPIHGKAYGVTQINQNTIAITYPFEIAIKIFNMENEKVTKFITLDKQCWGLSFSNNSLAVGLIGNNGDDEEDDDDGEIRIIDLEGNTLKSIQIESESDLEHLVYCNDRVIYSNFDGNAVCCVGESGKQFWQNTQDLKGPGGLCTDTYGNIIVVDYYSGRIVVISKDGQDSKVLISEEDRLDHPQCICFKHNESSGFICDYKCTNLAKFNLSSG